MSRPPNRRVQASILVGLLWCVALLSVVVIGVLHTARMDLQVVKNHGDRIQAHYLALAGVEKAKALLYQDMLERRQTSKNHTGELYDSDQVFRDVALGRGRFSVIRPGREDEGGGLIYGIADEESRLNVNQADAETLAKLPGITPDVVAAITDWRDPDNNVSPGGAEAEYYLELRPPYIPRNGPFQTLRELLMVRGVSSELLLGDDAEQNGLLDFQANANEPARKSRGTMPNAGWSELLSVDGWVNNVNASGTDRVNIQTADETALTGIRGITTPIAKAIIAYRGQGQNKNRFESVADLLEVGAVQDQGTSRTRAAGNANQASGPKVIDENLLMEIADDLTADQTREQAGLVNINTARATVLACLPGIGPDLAQAIVSHRLSNGVFPNVAWLLKVPGMSHEILRQVAPKLTARSETFRIIGEGKINSSGTRQRIQAIVHLGSGKIDTLEYREDL